MEQHIARYTKYIHEDLSTLDVETATYKEHLHKSFEWFACMRLSIQYDSIFLRWEDVPPSLREEKGMSRDMGIDAWDIEGNRVSQMKLYQGCISWRHFATFLGCCFKFKDAVKILYRTQESQLCSMIQSYVEDHTIVDSTITGDEFRSECKRIQSLTFPSSKKVESYVNRPYQAESIAYLEKGKDNTKNVYLCIPTGCGKTVILLHYHLHYRMETLLVLVPRVVLMEQWGEECDMLGIKPYLIGTGHHRNMEQYKDETIVICVYDSFPNIYDQRDRFKRYCVDEAHHVKIPERYMETEAEHDTYDSEEDQEEYEEEYDEEYEEDEEDEEDQDDQEEKPMSYMKCIQSLSDTKRAIYLSATLDPPTDDSLFFEYKVRQAINEGYLCDYQFVFPIFEQEYVTNEHLAQYLVHKQHESHCVIYAPSCKEGKEFADMLHQLRKGCAGYIDADTSYKERQRLFAEFESGALQFLVNIRILVEGFNAPHIRSIFFLKVSTSEIFIIQAIGRALRPHCDKRHATIYVPFTQESDAERIQTFLHQLSTYDERVRQSISQKKMGGYVSLEHGEDVEDEDDEKQEDTVDLFTFRYNMIVDRMGNSNQLEEMAIKRALEYKAFYEEFGRKPTCVIGNKKKEHITNASYEQKHEQRLSQWFYDIKKFKKGKRILYPSVEKIMIELLGEKWYENINLEENAIKKALEYKTFYEENKRKPVLILCSKTKEQKENATDEQKHEHKLATWFSNMKKAKKHRSTTVLYPSIEKILIELLGEMWYDDLKENAIQRALEFKRFYEENKRPPSQILVGKTKEQKENATDEQKHEHKLATWFSNMKKAKKNMYVKGSMKLYPTVEKTLIELLGETWYENENLEELALDYTKKYVDWYNIHKRHASELLDTRRKKEQPPTDDEKEEHENAQWYNRMRSKKNNPTRKSVLYPSVEKLLSDHFGEDWYKNRDLESMALKNAEEYASFFTTYKRIPRHVYRPKNDLEIKERQLNQWFGDMKKTKTKKGKRILYASVEKILVERIGDKWYENIDFERVSLDTAHEYIDWFTINKKHPMTLSKTLRKAAPEERIREANLAYWMNHLKQTKKSNGSMIVYQSVEQLLVSAFGESWYENLDREGQSRIIVKEYIDWYNTNKRHPAQVIKSTKERDSASDDKKYEQYLSSWMQHMKKTKKKPNKKSMKLWPSVEKILIERFGEEWFT